MAFKTDYKDDIYSGNRKYIQTTNEDGSVSFSDATNYDQQGDYFGSNELNAVGVKLNEVDLKAPLSHVHNADNITGGVLPLVRGGTGQNTASGVRNSLGLGNTTGALPIANGGTGATTGALAIAALGAIPRVTRATYIGNTEAMVVGELMWKAFGTNHTVFDASAGTNPLGGACNNTDPTTYWQASYPTLMGFNGSTTYGVRVDTARWANTANYANTAGSAPANGGTASNSDMVDGVHIVAQTTIPGSLSNNVLCIVYE